MTPLVSVPSPDGKYVAVFSQMPSNFVDTNYALRIQNQSTRASVFDHATPDERPSDGSISARWNANSTAVVVTGNCFYFADVSVRLATGEAVYMLVEVPSGDAWTNSVQSSNARLTSPLLEQHGFQIAVGSQQATPGS